ncbi:MAG: Stp1/IreP family PP2C-type Ser/Thr phosphatase [Chloroflexaceae bacterium]|nr:Stp1/IreP family PP2C-type Ser/Thr phosphatase [Chloroflexaceae bacterium]
MHQPPTRTCFGCGRSIAITARYCPYCGTPVPRGDRPDEIIVADGRRLRVAQDALSLRGLLAIVESSVAWWQHKLQSTDATTRQQAASAIKELSLILDSLAQQLALGRDVVKITTRLPVQRASDVTCAVCGHGNRRGARFCYACGAKLFEPGTRPTSAPVPPRLRLRMAARSDTGQMRQNNEDTSYTGILTTAGGAAIPLLLVADGMGGAQAGERASSLAAETVRRELTSCLQASTPPDGNAWAALLRDVVINANSQVYQEARGNTQLRGMGTTLTLLAVVGTEAYMAHVGDSRAYLCNANGVTDDGATAMQLSIDHTLVARLVDIGQLTPKQARVHPQRNIIYRALGTNEQIEVDTLSQPVGVGDALVVCSDGLTSHVEDTELASIVLAAASPEQACEQLIALANHRGGSDNISVVVASVEGIIRD